MTEKLDGLWIPLTEIAPEEFEEKVAASIAESFTVTGKQAANILLRPLNENDTILSEAAGPLPLTLQGFKYKIIAGRNRREAARRAKWKSIRADVMPYKTETDRLKAERLELDENDLRKDVGPSIRAANAQRRAEIDKELGLLAQQGGDRRSKKADADQKDQLDPLENSSDSAKKPTKRGNEAASTGVSTASAQRNLHRGKLSKAILAETAKHPHLDKGVELDALVDLPPEKRQEVLDAAAAGKTLKPSTVLKQINRDNKEILLAGHQSAITGKYAVVYADPPWKFEVRSEAGMDRAAENHYPTMTLADIMAMPIADICHDDAVCYMWATGPFLMKAGEVMKAWGFEYKAHFVWVKDKAGPGYWTREQSEILLIGTRGQKSLCPAQGQQFSSVIDARRGDHSSKPDEAYEIIEKYHKTLSKIELFQRAKGRRARKGWAVFGNESSAAEAAAEIPQERSGTAREAPSTTEEPGAAGVGAQPAAPSSTPSEEKGRAPEATDRAIAGAAASGRPPRPPLPPPRPLAPGQSPDLEARRAYIDKREAAEKARKEAEGAARLAKLPVFGRGPEISKPALPDEES